MSGKKKGQVESADEPIIPGLSGPAEGAESRRSRSSPIRTPATG